MRVRSRIKWLDSGSLISILSITIYNKSVSGSGQDQGQGKWVREGSWQAQDQGQGKGSGSLYVVS